MRHLLGVVSFLLLAAALPGATFTVTSTNDAGAGSLRQAITDANGAAGSDTVAFNVSGAGCDGAGVCTIVLASQLPTVSGTVLIDGYTQSGASPNTNATGAINAVLKIVVSGANVPGAQGLILSASDTVVRGLVMNGGFSYTVSMSGANTKVQGCFIGTNAAGSAAVPNDRGVYSTGLGGSFTVGGPAPADRNLISGNSAQDVWASNSTNVTIQGNLIGTDASGAVALSPTGGIVVSPTRAGGVIRGNVVAGATFSGVTIGSGSDTEFGTVVEGNFIGTDVTGTVDLGSTQHGIIISAKQVSVGGIGPGEGNVIAFNGGAGVFVGWGGASGPRQNPIRGNSIHSNHTNTNFTANPGIDLDGGSGGGFSPNDLGDGDIGGNDLQNFPLISSAVPSGGSTTVQGSLNSLASTTFDIDFYSNLACVGRPQGFLEGRIYLGSTQVTTNGSGNATINVVLPVAIAAGSPVTGTSTDPEGNTSEFSQRIVVSSSPGSGSSAGAAIILSGFNFLPGATVTVGGVPATNVVVVNFNTITATTPALAPGSLNNVTVNNTDGSSGTLPNGWIADFLDMPGHQFYTFVTTLVRNAITVGVGGGNYGVAQGTKRQQMAVFLLKAKYGICYVPPACTGVFPDVPCSSNFAPWIEALAAEGITTGCGGGLFCPENLVTRRQMAVFLLKTKYGSSYAPPACTGIFGDVLCPSAPAVDFIERLYNEQITGGCQASPLLYCPDGTSTRGQMAVFIVKTFSLQ